MKDVYDWDEKSLFQFVDAIRKIPLAEKAESIGTDANTPEIKSLNQTGVFIRVGGTAIGIVVHPELEIKSIAEEEGEEPRALTAIAKADCSFWIGTKKPNAEPVKETWIIVDKNGYSYKIHKENTVAYGGKYQQTISPRFPSEDAARSFIEMNGLHGWKPQKESWKSS